MQLTDGLIETDRGLNPRPVRQVLSNDYDIRNPAIGE